MTVNNFKSQCFEIYKLCFNEPNNDFANLLFETCFDYCVYKVSSGKVVSMFFALPCKLITEEEQSATYIFAAATHPSHRKKGYMSTLLNEYTKNHNQPIFLRPATDKLINFYKNFGFENIVGINNVNKNRCLVPTENFKILGEKYKVLNGNTFTLMVKNSCINFKIHFPYSME